MSLSLLNASSPRPCPALRPRAWQSPRRLLTSAPWSRRAERSRTAGGKVMTTTTVLSSNRGQRQRTLTRCHHRRRCRRVLPLMLVLGPARRAPLAAATAGAHSESKGGAEGRFSEKKLENEESTFASALSRGLSLFLFDLSSGNPCGFRFLLLLCRRVACFSVESVSIER